MQSSNQNLRKRKRRPTLVPRFGSSTLALEIGLLRLSLGVLPGTEEERSEKKSTLK